LTDYATATECKAFTRVAYTDFADLDSSEFDAFVAILAGFASRAMETYCGGRDWASHDDSTNGIEYSVGPQNQRTIRIKGPVISITSVEYRDGPGDTYSTLDSDNYTYQNYPRYGPVSKSPVTHLKRVGFGAYTIGRLPRYWVNRMGSTSWKRWRVVWWRGYDNVRVKYTWGYASIPDDINRICVMLVDDWLKKALKDEVGKRVRATEPEDLQLLMRYEIPAHLKEQLDPWKNPGGMGSV